MSFEDLKYSLADKPAGFFVLVGAVILFIVVSVFSFTGNRSKRVELEEAIANGNARVMELSSELGRVSGSEPTEDDRSVMLTTMHSAVAAGNAVAAYQMQYYDIRNRAPASADQTAEETYAAAVSEIAAAISAYLDESAKGACVPWFSCDDVSSRFVWKFRTNYEFATTEMECLWTCEDSKGIIVAFAIGIYSFETGLFRDVRYYMTQYGVSTYHIPEEVTSMYVEPLDGSGGYGVSVGGNASGQPHFDADGNLVNADGSPFGGLRPANGITPEDNPEEYADWAAQMEELFKQSKEYREQQLKAQEGS